MASIVTEFVGPRPGCYIMKFCQGATEIIGRIVTLVISVGVFIVSAVCLAMVAGLPQFSMLTPDDRRVINQVENTNYATLLLNSYAGGGVGLGAALLIIIWEALMIILRFTNIGLLNLKIKIFLGIDIVVGLILAVVVNIAGILGAFMASEWNRVNLQMLSFDPTNAINSLIALAVFGLLDGLLLALLATWMIVFLLRKWNEKVVKETAKDVI